MYINIWYGSLLLWGLFLVSVNGCIQVSLSACITWYYLVYRESRWSRMANCWKPFQERPGLDSGWVLSSKQGNLHEFYQNSDHVYASKYLHKPYFNAMFNAMTIYLSFHDLWVRQLPTAHVNEPGFRFWMYYLILKYLRRSFLDAMKNSIPVKQNTEFGNDAFAISAYTFNLQSIVLLRHAMLWII